MGFALLEACQDYVPAYLTCGGFEVQGLGLLIVPSSMTGSGAAAAQPPSCCHCMAVSLSLSLLEQTHADIRKWLAANVSPAVAEATRIEYRRYTPGIPGTCHSPCGNAFLSRHRDRAVCCTVTVTVPLNATADVTVNVTVCLALTVCPLLPALSCPGWRRLRDSCQLPGAGRGSQTWTASSSEGRPSRYGTVQYSVIQYSVSMLSPW